MAAPRVYHDNCCLSCGKKPRFLAMPQAWIQELPKLWDLCAMCMWFYVLDRGYKFVELARRPVTPGLRVPHMVLCRRSWCLMRPTCNGFSPVCYPDGK